MSCPLIGVTLFSFTNEWQERLFTLDTLLEAVAANGLGPGVELVGFQSIRGYPALTDAFADSFREKVAALGLIPTALAGNADLGIRRDRIQTVDEAVAYLEPQIVAARRLGFRGPPDPGGGRCGGPRASRPGRGARAGPGGV